MCLHRWINGLAPAALRGTVSALAPVNRALVTAAVVVSNGMN